MTNVLVARERAKDAAVRGCTHGGRLVASGYAVKLLDATIISPTYAANEDVKGKMTIQNRFPHRTQQRYIRID